MLGLLDRKALSSSELMEFLEHVSIVIREATILQTVMTYYPSTENGRKFKARLIQLLNNGTLFDVALARLNSGLNAFELLIIRSGLESGNIAESIEEIIEARKEEAEIQNKLIGSLIMPAITFVTGCVVFLFGIYFLIPKFEAMFLQNIPAHEIPRESRMIFNIAANLRKWLIIFIIGTGIALNILFNFINVWDLPLLRKFNRLKLIYVFFSNMKLLISSGISPQSAIEKIAIYLPRKNFYDKLKKNLFTVINNIKQGMALPKTINKNPFFTEETGVYFEMAVKSGDYVKSISLGKDKYKSLFYNFLNYSTKIINPVLFFFIAGVIGFIVAALYIPIIQSATAIK